MNGRLNIIVLKIWGVSVKKLEEKSGNRSKSA
jgi:hypothetical protein